MKLDLTEIYERVEPWECVLEVERGEELRVRRLTVVDMAQLDRIVNGGEKPGEALKFVTEIFEEPKPDVVKWDPAKVGIVVSAVVQYYRSAVVQKKSLAAVEAVAAMVRTTSGTGRN